MIRQGIRLELRGLEHRFHTLPPSAAGVWCTKGPYGTFCGATEQESQAKALLATLCQWPEFRAAMRDHLGLTTGR